MGNPLAENIGTGANLLSVLQALTGSKGVSGTTTQTASGGTQTQQTQISQEGVAALLKEILSGNQGLASVAQGQKKAGVYNSATNRLLLNDLLSSAAAKVEAARSPQVTTTTPKTTVTERKGEGATQGILPSWLTKGLGYGSLGLSALGAAKSKAAQDLFGGISESLGGLSMGSPFDVPSGLAESIFDVPSGAIDNAGIANFSVDQLSPLISGGTSTWDMMADTGSSWMIDTGTALGDVGIPGLGSVINLLSGNNQGGQAGENAVLSMIPGVGPVLAAANSLDIPIISDVVDVAGDFVSEVGDALGCFITTAICKTLGKPDDCAELTSLRAYRDTWLTENHPEEIIKYYAEAPGIVSKINSFRSPAEIWKSLYSNYLVPALDYVARGENAAAYGIYRDMFNTAKRLANG